MKKIIITGSNGLLGQSLLNLLLQEKENYQVFGFSRGRIEVEEKTFLMFQLILQIKKT